MNGRTWLLSAAMLVGLAAQDVALADSADTKARIEQLEKKLDELQGQMPTYGAQGREGGTTVTVRRTRSIEIRTQVEEVKDQIIRLSLGAELALKYDRYRRRQAEFNQQYRDLWADRSLDREARQAQMAEIRKKQTALSSDYADVVSESQAVRQRLNYRRYHAQRLARLKPLLKVKDEEWKVLEPRIRDVLRRQDELRRLSSRTRASYFGAGGSFRWRATRTSSPEGALAEVLKKENATTPEIRAKIDAVRKAREERTNKVAEAEKKVKTARDHLRELLTTRQEGVLVVERILD